MISSQIRREFLSFFQANDHMIQRSAPVIPDNDPTLLFTAAGMVPFKDYFLGLSTPPHGALTSSQRCIRAGGKHNDLENVGYTKRHNTFFEMLGNFSFTKYFKEEAIYYAWTFLTKNMGLNPEKISVTYYHTDEQTAKIWRGFLPENKIKAIATDDNFWSVGTVGLCGPCTELFYDFSDLIKHPEQASEDERVVELWNLVFMQFDMQENGIQAPLERVGVDTGMGLERIACVMQGVDDNYKTDILWNIKKAFSDIISVPITSDNEVCFNVISDHLRAATFLISDGVFPDNVGRGYVLRKILRRAMRYEHKLGKKEPFLHKLCFEVMKLMEDVSPEINTHRYLIEETVLNEEHRFGDILKKGMIFFDNTLDVVSGKDFPAKVVFELYDTFGFPIDLTYELLWNKGLFVDKKQVDVFMTEQKQASKKNWKGFGDTEGVDLWKRLATRIPATEFTGYESQESNSRVLALVSDNKELCSLKEGEEAWVILDRTPFYAESGGQLGDTGSLSGSRFDFLVSDTQKFAKGLFAHKGILKKGFLTKDDVVCAHISRSRRLKTQAHHTATHLLHQGLRLHFSDSVVQKGSLVSEDHLRFDFHLAKPLQQRDIIAVENWVNEKILENHLVSSKEYPIEEARDLKAIGLFGEKYGDVVRVVSVGDSVSREFCGGCHVNFTGDIGLFRIVSHSSIGSDTKRIMANVGISALMRAQEDDLVLQEMQKKLGVVRGDLLTRIDTLLKEHKKKKSEDKSAPLIQEEIEGISFFQQKFEGGSINYLRKAADALTKEINRVVVVWSVDGQKVSVVVALSHNIAHKINIHAQIKEMSKRIADKPNGGGRVDFVQCGGNKPECMSHFIQDIRERILSCFM